jgi:hypothetical protein
LPLRWSSIASSPNSGSPPTGPSFFLQRLMELSKENTMLQTDPST